MKNYSLFPYQNDLMFDEKKIKTLDNNKINVLENNKNNHLHKTIFYNAINKELQQVLTKEISLFLQKLKIKKNDHLFIIGLGSDTHTPDAIGPNTLKYIKVNAYLENIGLKIDDTKVSALKPGVLGETGILTEKTIINMTKEINPNLVIIIDSFVTNDINFLNHTIELNNAGITPGIGLKGISSQINEEILGVPVLIIGVTTAVLIRFTSNENINFIPYILSTKDIDEYVVKISELIGQSINKAISSLK